MKGTTSNHINNPSVIVLIPVFNDWKALELLLSCLDNSLYDNSIQAEILVVDDASSIPVTGNLMLSNLKAIKRVSTLELKRNLDLASVLS